MKVLFIGDDPEFVNFATAAVRLRWPNLTPLVAYSAISGLKLVEEQLPDVVLLHALINDLPLSECVRGLRQLSTVPLLVLGVQPDHLQVLAALEMGADDYVRLPCPLSELTVRVWAVIRRAGIQGFESGGGPLLMGNLLIKPATYEAFLDGCRLSLSVTEFRLLHTLASSQGQVVSHRLLEQTICHEKPNSGQLVRKNVQRLRGKLKDDLKAPFWIVSVHGVGYRFGGPDQTVEA